MELALQQQNADSAVPPSPLGENHGEFIKTNERGKKTSKYCIQTSTGLFPGCLSHSFQVFRVCREIQRKMMRRDVMLSLLLYIRHLPSLSVWPEQASLESIPVYSIKFNRNLLLGLYTFAVYYSSMRLRCLKLSTCLGDTIQDCYMYGLGICKFLVEHAS